MSVGTLKTWGFDERRFRTVLTACLLASLLIHIFFFLSLKEIALMPPGAMVVNPPEKSVRLEFVDSPERIQPPPDQPRETNLISDRASLAQDVIPDKTESTEIPRAVGEVKEKSIRQVPGGEAAKPQEAGSEPERLETKAEGIISPGETRRKESDEPGKALPWREGESPFRLRGKDEFLSPEGEIPDGKTNILKQVAYNALSPEVGKYLARLKPRVKNLWDLTIMKNTFYVRSEKTTVFFKIRPDGSLGEIKAEHEGPDHEMFYGLNAVEKAQPFEPLSEEILEYIKDDGLWLELNFTYYH